MRGNEGKSRGGWIGTAAALAFMLFCITGVVRWIAGDAAGMAAAMRKFAPPDYTGLPEAEYDGVTEMLTGYLTGKRESFQYTWQGLQGETLLAFHDYEAAHMADCRSLIRLDEALSVFCLVLWPALTVRTGIRARKNGRSVWISFFRGGEAGFWVLSGILALLLLWACMDFDSLFLLFHRIAFRNDLWLLDPRTDLLIRLMPEGLFVFLGIRGGIAAGAGILFAGILLAVGRRLAER